MYVEYLWQSIRIRIRNRTRSNKERNYYPYPIRICENYGYPQNIYPRIHIRPSLVSSNPIQSNEVWRAQVEPLCPHLQQQ